MADQCDYCAYFVYDEYTGQYLCEQDLDEDELYRFLTQKTKSCPYFKDGDEYKLVRHQN